MKKQLLSILAALTVGNVLSQVPALTWSISQNAAFTNTSVGIKFMDAVSPNVVWVTGYDGFAPSRNYNWISHTTNGGNTWTANTVFPDTNTYILSNMEGIDGNTAWTCSFLKATQGDGAIHRTTNGGASWTNMTATGMFTNNVSSFANFVSFLTPSVGIVNGDPVNGEYELWRTTDGGLSWSQISGANIPDPLTPSEFAIVNLYAKQGTTNLWFGTNQGRMYRTTDAGLTWSVAAVAAPSATITEIAFTTPLNGVCYAYNGGSEMYNTYDGGATWNQINPLPANLGLNDVIGVPGTNSLVSVGAGAGNNIISYSMNNGLTWTDYGSTNIQYLTADFADGLNGWSGSFSDNTNPAVGGIWKYSGGTGGGTVAPTSAFTMPANVCLTGPSATIAPTNSSTGSPVLTYTWSVAPAGATISNPNIASPVITFNSANTYTVILLVGNGVGVNPSSQVVIVQTCSVGTAGFTVPTTTLCSGVSFNLTNTSTGGSPAPSYSWSAIGGNVTFSPSPIVFSPSITAATPGTYTIVLVATNNQGTTQATQVVTLLSGAPTASFTMPSTIYFCSTDPTQQQMNGLNKTTANPPPCAIPGGNTYTWSVAPTTSLTYQAGPNSANYTATANHTSIPQYTVTLKAKNAAGISTYTQLVTVVFNDCVGINENSFLANNLLVFPNPAHEQLNLTLPASNSAYQVKLINVLGATVFEDKAVVGSRENVSISLGGKPKGIYFLTVESKNEKVTRKIVIE